MGFCSTHDFGLAIFAAGMWMLHPVFIPSGYWKTCGCLGAVASDISVRVVLSSLIAMSNQMTSESHQ